MLNRYFKPAILLINTELKQDTQIQSWKEAVNPISPVFWIGSVLQASSH